jgi:alpha-tubulin suppressor-like RCC1 family protein
VVHVSCGKDFTLIVTRSGQLFAFGINTQNQLPFKTSQTPACSEAKKVNLRANVQQVSASDSPLKVPSLILTADHQLYIGMKLIKVEEPIVMISNGYCLGETGSLY